MANSNFGFGPLEPPPTVALAVGVAGGVGADGGTGAAGAGDGAGAAAGAGAGVTSGGMVSLSVKRKYYSILIILKLFTV